jgi:transposase
MYLSNAGLERNVLSEAIPAEPPALHSRKWWMREGVRNGSDWDSVLRLHADVVATIRAKYAQGTR